MKFAVEYATDEWLEIAKPTYTVLPRVIVSLPAVTQLMVSQEYEPVIVDP